MPGIMPLALKFVFFQKTIGCLKGVSSPSPEGETLGLPPGPWSQERQRPRQKRSDPFSLSALGCFFTWPVVSGCSHSSLKSKSAPRSDPRIRVISPANTHTVRAPCTGSQGSLREM